MMANKAAETCRCKD